MNTFRDSSLHAHPSLTSGLFVHASCSEREFCRHFRLLPNRGGLAVLVAGIIERKVELR